MHALLEAAGQGTRAPVDPQEVPSKGPTSSDQPYPDIQMLPSDMMMSTDIQVAFGFYQLPSAVDVHPRATTGHFPLPALQHFDVGFLGALAVTSFKSGFKGIKFLIKKRATKSIVFGTRQVSITNRVRIGFQSGIWVGSCQLGIRALVSMGPERGGFRRGTRQSSRVRGQDPLPEQEEIPIPTPVPEPVQMARLARKGILEHFRAVLDLEWIAYAWAKMDGRF
ncbi:unnamed protein product [Prunus armeniaca]